MIDILIDAEHPEGQAKFVELCNALDAAQIPNKTSEEGDHYVVAVEDEYETQLMNAVLALGLDTADYDEDVEGEEDEVDDLYREDVDQAITKVLDGMTPQEALAELIIPHYFSGKDVPDDDKKKKNSKNGKDSSKKDSSKKDKK